MSASHNLFSPQNGAFDITYLISNINLQYQSHCEHLNQPVAKHFTVKEHKHTEEYPHSHYQITFGHVFSAELIQFFLQHGVNVRPSRQPDSFLIKKSDLTRSSLTYRDAHHFLFELHATIQDKENTLQRRP